MKDRKMYQLPPGSRDLAILATKRCLKDGADFVMVKPGGPYMDIIRDLANFSKRPIAVYQVCVVTGSKSNFLCCCYVGFGRICNDLAWSTKRCI